MQVGILGFERAGKTTLYHAAARGQAKGDVTAVPVPDPRFDRIVAQVRPKKATPASVVLHDRLEAVQGGTSRLFTQRFLDSARQMQALLHVVRAFESPTAPYYDDVDPRRDLETVEVELVLADLAMVEARLERLAKAQAAKAPGSTEYLERVLFEKIHEPLETGTPLRAMEFDEDEREIVRNYQFLSAKPCIVAFNVDESDAADAPQAVKRSIEDLAKKNTPAFAMCATLEAEIAQLEPADQQAFLVELGIEEPASAKVIRAAYEGLGLITFFTAGENETRAWALERGASALKAAGTIHTDIAKGFIRAEVVHYDDYAAHGSLDAAYKAGAMRLEGKDYVVRDGDLLHIRNKS